jgi:hypothetical protein
MDSKASNATRQPKVDPLETMSGDEVRAALAGEVALEEMRQTLERAAQKLAAFEANYQEAANLSSKATVLSKAVAFVATSQLPNVLVALAAGPQRRMHVLLPDEVDHDL